MSRFGEVQTLTGAVQLLGMACLLNSLFRALHSFERILARRPAKFFGAHHDAAAVDALTDR